LIDYDFKIIYQSRKIHDKADVLTRRPENKFSNENDARNKHMHQTLLSADKLNDKLKKNLINNLEEDETSLQLFKRVMKLNKSDVICIELRKVINKKKHNYKQ
jgi:hypothetical protein